MPTSLTTISDHPLRYALTNELHARPFPTLTTPSTACYIAFKPVQNAAARDRAADLKHLTDLLDRHGVAHPPPGATHYSGRIGRHLLKWESHTEFVTYTTFCEGVSTRAFDPADFEVFPADWLQAAPGVRITSSVARIEAMVDRAGIATRLNEWFVPESLAASFVLDEAAVVAGDFRIDPAGHIRLAIFVAPQTGARRIGRIVQRMLEIETYKTMSMLGFARVREIGNAMGQIDKQLTQLMSDMQDDEKSAELTLAGLLSVSAELENLGVQTSFRFGATAAYEAIVHQRVEVLRETRFDGRQTLHEFMMRRYDPAMRTVKASESRLRAMSDRAIRAGELLRTRVDVERSAQNQLLLESMNQRADMQLRLQKTVEGLSTVAISYYAVSLAGYLLYPLAEPLGLSKGLLMALVTPLVVGAVWWNVRKIHEKFH